MPTVLSSGVTPSRIDHRDPTPARQRLSDAGAVVLTGLSPGPDTLVLAAALLHSERLRQLFPLAGTTSCNGATVHLHSDSFDVQVDIGGVLARRRVPVERRSLPTHTDSSRPARRNCATFSPPPTLISTVHGTASADCQPFPA